MKRITAGIVFFLLVVGLTSCTKDSIITSPAALLSTSTDTLRFDTVFTSVGSVTHSFKIFNQNSQKLRLSNVQLMGGATSTFKMNVDGTSGTAFRDIEIAPNDSLYVFVSVAINPSAANLPFVVQDSVLVNYNGNDHFVQLEAYGQNANFLRNARLSSNTTWSNNLPYVILGGVTIDPNVTLTLSKGTRLYFHANAPMIVNGTLKVNGERYDSTKVSFQSDRLDPDYRLFPGSWPGIIFSQTSKDNVITQAIIKNAYQGIVAQLPASNGNYKVTLNQCIIDNIYDAGILSVNSSINATNCLISNCGNNIAIAAGGTYNFTHCTVVSYSNLYLLHKNPVLFISNSAENQTFPLSADFRNCIFWGEGGTVEDEISVSLKGTGAVIRFDNILYKSKNNITPAPAASIRNQPPLFDSIDAGRRYFNFRLKETSPAINKGANFFVTTDIDDNPRTLPDIGCYERQ